MEGEGDCRFDEEVTGNCMMLVKVYVEVGMMGFGRESWAIALILVVKLGSE